MSIAQIHAGADQNYLDNRGRDIMSYKKRGRRRTAEHSVHGEPLIECNTAAVISAPVILSMGMWAMIHRILIESRVSGASAKNAQFAEWVLTGLGRNAKSYDTIALRSTPPIDLPWIRMYSKASGLPASSPARLLHTTAFVANRIWARRSCALPAHGGEATRDASTG